MAFAEIVFCLTQLPQMGKRTPGFLHIFRIFINLYEFVHSYSMKKLLFFKIKVNFYAFYREIVSFDPIPPIGENEPRDSNIVSRFS